VPPQFPGEVDDEMEICAAPLQSPGEAKDDDDEVERHGHDDAVVRIRAKGSILSCHRIAGNNHCIKSVTLLCGTAAEHEGDCGFSGIMGDPVLYGKYKRVTKTTDSGAKVYDMDLRFDSDDDDDDDDGDEDSAKGDEGGGKRKEGGGRCLACGCVREEEHNYALHCCEAPRF